MPNASDDGAIPNPARDFQAARDPGIGATRQYHPRVTRRIASSHVLLIVVLAACSSPGPETSFRSDDPSARTRALARAVQTDDYGAIPDIIVLLDSSDPALRMLAIQALEDLTGETLGYDHAGPEDERREAADAWAEWWLTTGRTRAGGQKTAPADAEGVGT